jgi:hypothetical protein
MNLDALATLQFQVVHRHQLLRAGVSSGAIQRRLATGEWQRLLPAVYALFADEARHRHQVVAALLYAGADAQVAGRTALRLYGLHQVAGAEGVHVLVPHHRQLGSVDFAVLHRTSRLDIPHRVGRFPICSVSRAVADTARWGAPTRELRSIVAEAVARRLTTVAALRAELAGSRRNRTAGLRLALAEVAGLGPGAESDLRTSLLQSRVLPRIVWHPRLRGADGRTLVGPQAWIPAAALGVQIDDGTGPVEGAEEASAEALAGYGALVLRFTPSRLRRDPVGVRRAVERAYLQRRSLGARVPIELA